jgi:cell division protein FtsL
MRMCRQGRLDYLGLLSFLAIALPMTVILLNGVIGDAVIDAVVPGVYAGFEVFFARLYTLSLLALLLPICILVGVASYLTFVFHPSQVAHKKRKEKMKRLELEASYLQTRTSKHTAHAATRGSRRNVSQFSATGYFFRVFKIFVRTAQHGITWLSFEKRLNNTRQKRVNNIWRLMNAPHSTQGHIAYGKPPVHGSTSRPFSPNKKLGPRHNLFLPPGKITDMMTSSTQWKALHLERQNVINTSSTENRAATSSQIPIVTRPKSYRSTGRKLSSLFVFDAKDLLKRLRAQLVVDKSDDVVSVQGLRDAFEEMMEVFYPDGIPLSEAERTEAADLFKRWKERDCPKGQPSVQNVSMLAFEEWFMQEFMCVFRSTLPERLVDHSLRYVPDLKQRKSHYCLSSSYIATLAPRQMKTKVVSRIHPLASSLVISLDDIYAATEANKKNVQSPTVNEMPTQFGHFDT